MRMSTACRTQQRRYRRWGPILLLLACACTVSAAPVPASCSEIWLRQGIASMVDIAVDCVWDASAGVGSVVGQKQEPTGTPGPPAIIASQGKAQHAKVAGTTPFSAAYVILVGFSLPDPSDKTQALIPAGLASTTAVSVALQDVRILVDSDTLQQHVKFFSAQAGVTYYTDGSTFLHVNYYATSSASWQSVGLLLATDLQDARATSIPFTAGAASTTVSSANRGLLQEPNRRSKSSISSSSRTEQFPESGTAVKQLVLQRSSSTGGSRSWGLQDSSSGISSSTAARVVLWAGSSSRRILQEGRSNPAAESPTDAVAAAVAAPSPPKYGYVLAATNDTLVPLMQRIGAVGGPAAAIIYLDSNVTLSKPPVPNEGILVARPLVLVGLVQSNTSVDLHMIVNQIYLNETWSNLTIDRLVVENMAPGDAKSAEEARPLSVSSANNFWSLYYPRSENRLFIKNCTMVVGGQSELDYYLYWATVYHSSLPYFRQLAKFIRDVIQVTVWELADAGQADSSILVVHQVAGSCTVEDSLYTVKNVVAPKLTPPPVDPSLQLHTAAKSPLVTAVSTVTSLREQLAPLGSPEAGRTHVVLLRTNITLPAATAGSNRGLGADVPPTGLPVPQPISILGDFSSQVPSVLDLGFARNLLEVPPYAKEDQVQVQHLVLRGLAQGPAAATATSLSSPDVWTILAWAFNRSTDKSVSFSACTLELPPQEFEALQQQAAVAGGQVILKMTGDVPVNGDGLFVINDMTIGNLPSNNLQGTALQVGSFAGHGISGTNVTLVPLAAAAAVLGGYYYWPGGPLPTLAAAAGSGRQVSGSNAAAAPIIAAAIVGGVALMGGVLALLLIRRRRQQRQQQQQRVDLEKALYALSGDQLLPPATAGSSSSRAGIVTVPNDKSGGTSATDSAGRDVSGAAAATPDSQDQFQSRNSSRSCGGSSSSKYAASKQRPVSCHARQIAACDTDQAAAAAALTAGEAASYSDLLSTSQQQQLWSLAQQLDLAERQLQQHRQQGLELIQIIDHTPPDQLGSNDPANPAAAAARTWPGHSPMFTPQQITQVAPDHTITQIAQITPGHPITQITHSTPDHQVTEIAQITPGHQIAQITHSTPDHQVTEIAQITPGHQITQITQGTPKASCNTSASCKTLDSQYGSNSRPSAADVTTDSAKSILDWQSAQHTVVRSQQQQQQYETLLHGVGSAGIALAVQRLQRKARQQGSAAVAAESSGDRAEQQQQQQQEAAVQGLPAPASPSAAPAVAAAAGGGGELGDLQSPRSPSGGSNSNPKLWERVSSAIGILQQGITQRRLAAAYAEAAQPTSAEGVKSDCNRSAAAATGCSVTAAAAAARQKETGRQADGCVAAAQQNSNGLQLQMLDMIGRGTFASVYRAIWRGRCVAVKVVHLPSDILGDGNTDVSAALRTRERMAVMEAVVSITMSHPNIVQVYTFALKPLPPPHVAGQLVDCTTNTTQRQLVDDRASGWELQLVMEYCPEGSLRHILNQQRLIDRSNGLPALPAVLALAHDVACAMLHLHSENLIHGDLKASNVLLAQSNAPLTGSVCTAGRGERLSCVALLAAQQAARGGRLVAKIADFGLSLSLAPGDTHVSHMHAGTLTHMAPELLLHGRASKLSDVYAFGILLWELATGRRAFQGVPVALIGHNVAHLRWRPGWLPGIPPVLRTLVEQCWAHEPSARPCFQDIVTYLEQLMQYTPDQLATLQLRQQQQPLSLVSLTPPPAAAAAAGAVSDSSSEWIPATAADSNAVTDAARGGSDTPRAGADPQSVTGYWSLPKQQRQRQQQQECVAEVCAGAASPQVHIDRQATTATAAAPTDDDHGTAVRAHEAAGVLGVAAGGSKQKGWTGDGSLPARQQQQQIQHAAATEAEQQQQQQQLTGDLTGVWSMPGRST